MLGPSSVNQRLPVTWEIGPEPPDIVSDASNATNDASAGDRVDRADVADAADADNPDGLSRDASASDALTSPWNYVFVTSSTYGTTLQPLEAADDN